MVSGLRRGLVVCAFVAFASPVLAGPNTECPQIPPSLTIDMWEPIVLGDRVYRVGLRYVPGGGAQETDDSASLEVLLLAQYLSPETRGIRTSSFVRGLAPVFSLRSAETEWGAGTLEPTLSPLGAGYGATVPVTEAGGSGALDLEVSFDPGALDPVEPRHEQHPEHEEPCAELPGGLSLALGVTMADLLGGLDLDGPEDAPSDTFRMNLLSSFDPRPSDNYSDVWGYTDGATYLAIIGATTGTSFVDVTDPAQPVEVGFIGGPSSSWRDIKTYGTYAYITTEGSGAGSGLQVVDLSDPKSPVLSRTYASTLTTAHNLYIDEDRGHAYIVGTGNGTRILDVATDPANPVEIASWTPRYVHDAYVKDGTAYFSEINDGLQEILDATDVTNLEVLATWQTPDRATHNCWANDAQTLLAVTDEVSAGGNITVWDITTKTAPAPLVSAYAPRDTTSVHNVYFEDEDDHRIAASHYAIGMRYLDLYRPSYPVELGAYDTYPSGDQGFNGAWGIYAYDPRGYLYVSDISNGLFVLEYAPTGGTLSGIVREAGAGSPVAGARVAVLESGEAVTTGTDGVYALYAPEGEITLRVTAAGYRSAILAAGTMPLDGRLDADVELALLPRTALTGTVRRADDALPIEGAMVQIAGTALSATTAADGTFAFPEVAVGQQVVTAEAFGFSAAEATIGLEEAASGSVDLVLEPGRFVDDAETNRAWTLGAPGDSASSGVWVRVDPNGTAGGTVQPENDRTPAPGVTAFITGQSNPGAGVEANDVDNGVTTLVSPAIDVADLGAARLGYHRWLSTNAGAFSGGRLLVQISSDNGATWQTLESQSSNANAWARRDFDIAAHVPLTSQMRVRFRAEPNSPASLTVLEAGVDDFEVVRACNVRLNPTAPDADRDGVADGCDACPAAMADDLDGDGVCGDADNAPFAANPDQLDADQDGVGDAADNCAGSANPDQRDLDGDALGDACDDDMDGDGLIDGVEDVDRDGDGIADALDSCPTVPDRGDDRDLDGEGDACDGDDGEVRGLRFATRDRLVWEPEGVGEEYHLYRGDLGAPALVPLATCLADSVRHEYAVDGTWPVPGDGFFYLVSVFGPTEGSLGRRSDGTERSVTARCP